MDTETAGTGQNISGEAGFNSAMYRNNCVRDLAWAIFSPPLVLQIETVNGLAKAPAFALTAARRLWLEALDAQPAPLLNFLASCQNRFLGVYFEALWRFFLLHDPNVTLLKCNQQIIDAGRTVGEFDMFYHCHRRNVTVHLELAVKFYLGLPVHADSDLQQPSFWLGPNCADRLDLKINHLRTHQLPLIGHSLARNWLAQEQLQPEIQEVALQGYLYYPWHIDATQAASAPHCAHQQHMRSYWLRDERLELLRQGSNGKANRLFRIVRKMHWLCSHLDDVATWQDFETFAQQINHEFSAPLMQPVLCEESDADGKVAVRRFFVAPQDWPALHWPKKKF